MVKIISTAMIGSNSGMRIILTDPGLDGINYVDVRKAEGIHYKGPSDEELVNIAQEQTMSMLKAQEVFKAEIDDSNEPFQW